MSRMQGKEKRILGRRLQFSKRRARFKAGGEVLQAARA